MANGSGKAITEAAVAAAQPGQFLWDGGRDGVPGLGLRVAPGGAKTWLLRYRNDAKQQRFLKLDRHPTLNVEGARKRAKVEAGRIAEGRDVQADKQAAKVRARDAMGDPTMADLANVYLADYAPARGLRPATILQARALLARSTTALGKVKVADVTTQQVRKLHGDTRAAGIAEGRKGVYQANRLLAVLSKAFGLAKERGWRGDNPCEPIRMFPEDQRWRNLSEDEVGRLLDACEDYEAGLRPIDPTDTPEEKARKSKPLPASARSATDREAADAICMLLFTGARMREVLKAEWSQFDLDRGLWEKPSAHTKTKRQHRLELEGPALSLLREMAARKSNPRLLFPGKPDLGRKATVDIVTGRPGGITARNDLKRPWRAISRMAALENVRIHDLRRTTASFMLSGGSSLATVVKALGHTQASTTQRYATLAASVQREGLAAAGEAMMAVPRRKERGTVVSLQAGSKGK